MFPKNFSRLKRFILLRLRLWIKFKEKKNWCHQSLREKKKKKSFLNQSIDRYIIRAKSERKPYAAISKRGNNFFFLKGSGCIYFRSSVSEKMGEQKAV